MRLNKSNHKLIELSCVFAIIDVLLPVWVPIGICPFSLWTRPFLLRTRPAMYPFVPLQDLRELLSIQYLFQNRLEDRKHLDVTFKI